MGRVNEILNLDREQRKRIDHLLAQGRSKASIGREFDVSENTLTNYQEKQLSPRLASAWVRKSGNDAVQVVDEMTTLLTQSQSVLLDALKNGHNSLALKAIAQIRGNLELVSRIQHAIAQQQRELITVEVKESDTRFSDEFREALASLSPEDRAAHRAVTIKAISKMGCVRSDDQDPTEEDDDDDDLGKD